MKKSQAIITIDSRGCVQLFKHKDEARFTMYDVIILGGGTAGLTAASIFKAAGLKYLIIHHGFKGTTCASRGCMPSKAFIQVAKTYHERTKFSQFGITGTEQISLDYAQVMKHVQSLRDRFTDGMIESMGKYEIVYGQAKFLDANTLDVEGTEYKAKNFIIATGSTPRIPDMYQPFKDDILTTDNFFDQSDLPESMAVVGLGAIGAELGQALARLGIKVTGINLDDNISRLTDADILKNAKQILSADMELMLDTEIESVERKAGEYHLKVKDKTITSKQILLAVGKTPNVDSLNLQDIGVEFTDKGIPDFDLETLKIKDFPIYMAGDCNTYKAILHEASDEAEIIAAQIMNKNIPSRRVPLGITFTHPNIAQIGKQPDDIEEDIITGCVSFEDQGRARVMGENKGMMKIFASKKNLTILGACMMAPAGEHMAHFLAMAVQQKLTVDEVLDLPFYHPTVEEGLRTALRDIQDANHDCVINKLC